MEKQTRNLIQKATQDARKLLESEFSEQLEGVFDILPDGHIVASPGEHLNARERIIRGKIVAAIEHEKAGGVSDAEGVAHYLREAAFTCLNRFVALKMLEARELVQECVSKGEQSAGFMEFCGLAPGLAELPDKGYRLYIESLFDELSREIRVLFDRRDLASLLWPGRKAFEGLLDILNRKEIAGVWGEDETIGWVYQYFNSAEERKRMRNESSTPRNSRELAVRNQFFTPRYVVEFLTDNTLGRIWYEMRQGNTRLKDECRYLVRRPDEVFFGPETTKDGPVAKMADLIIKGDQTFFPVFEADQDQLIHLAACVDSYVRHPFEDEVDGVWWPWWKKQQIENGKPLEDISTQDLLDVLFAEYRADRLGGDGEIWRETLTLKIANEIRRRFLDSRREDISQEDLLKSPVPVSFHPKKDPRDIKILDPACGSGHFLLYTFDLLEKIYEEAWEDQETPKSEATGNSILEGYPTIDDLRRHIPKLIIEHNLHGIDIDQRATQIAALSLWMRAQRSWQESEVKADERPGITKSNIVTAGPMPGEEDMRKEFIDGLRPRLLGQLVGEVFKKMELAGEAGALLKIEEEIKDAVAEAKRQWLEVPVPEQQTMFPGIGASKPRQLEMRFDVGGITEEGFWEQAEELIFLALKKYAKEMENDGIVRRRLFTEDTAQGFGFIDIFSNRYNVVLMNPPFGEVSQQTQNYLWPLYPEMNFNIFCCFVSRFLDLSDYVGAITDRSFMLKTSYEEFRRNKHLLPRRLAWIVDLEWGVLDANVEVNLQIFEPYSERIKVVNLNQSTSQRSERLSDFCSDSGSHWISHKHSYFLDLPNSVISYQLPVWQEHARKFGQRISKIFARAASGLKAGRIDRYVRLLWEIPENCRGTKKKWNYFQNGGPYAPYYYPTIWTIEFDDTWNHIKTVPSSRITGLSDYWKTGLSYGKRTDFIYCYPMPEGQIFSNEGMAIFPKYFKDMYSVMGYVNSNSCQHLMNLLAGQHKAHSYFNKMALEKPISDIELISSSKIIVESLQSLDSINETSIYFSVPFIETFSHNCGNFFDLSLESIKGIIEKSEKEFIFASNRVAELLNDSDAGFPKIPDWAFLIFEKQLNVDLIACNIISYVIGAALGRWDIRLALDPSLLPKLLDPFELLPTCPPGMLINSNGLPVEPNQIVSEEWLQARTEADTLPPEGLVQSPTISDSKYPIRISWDGILVDDPGFNGGQLHQEDIVRRSRNVLSLLWKDKAQDIEQEACNILKIPDLRTYFRKSFFPDHIKRYSKSRRKAPIYWQLATPSASYSVWLYYHRFTKDTFYKVLNEYIDPKLQFEERELVSARQQYGQNPTATQRKEIAARETFVAELTTFKEEAARIAPLWNPNLNDGVIINFAPLWRLVPQNKPWQKECKKIWDKLVKGDYDWAHLAMHLWPERVVPKCTKDRSLAIAHELDETLWEEDKKGKWHPKKISKETLEDLIQERTSITVKAALEELLNAPAPAGATRKKRKRKT